MLSLNELDSKFSHHPSTSDVISQAHTKIRETFREATEVLDDLIVDSREKSVMITKLEEGMFWANAALARSQEVN